MSDKTKNESNKKSWRDTSQLANYWHKTKGDTVQCELSPRRCELKPGQKGFCLVRGNVDGELHTFNYGISVQATIECIETEAVNHYRPGARILSMGNVGCMMACSYCQNWQTSQVKFLNDKNVNVYTPQQVIDLAVKNDIDIISWTYNDPVVWQEFVVDTSKLAREKGIETLYKSALYIEEKPLKELIEIIDIFSISLKGMSEEMYRKYTKGELAPVLDRIKLISKSDCHLEISQLIVTDLNDNDEGAVETANWMIENVGAHIPLHLVGYHPAFRYTKKRTSTETLLKMRKVALDCGLDYCYLGNVYADDVSNTNCKKCDNRLIQRFGLTVHIVGLDEKSKCTQCGTKSPIIKPDLNLSKPLEINDFESKQSQSFEWNTEINSIHVIVDDKNTNTAIKIIRNPGNKIEYMKIADGLERLIISKSFATETTIELLVNNTNKIDFLPVLDRAHFPVANPSKSSDKYLN